MAAGDVDITADTLLGSGLRLVVGTVTLDGSNPTAVDLSGYMEAVLTGVATIEGAGALADDPNQVTTAVSLQVLSIYAWKNTSGTDPTFVASANNSRLVNWMAIGPTLMPGAV